MNNIVSLLLGGTLVAAVLTFIQFLINRKDAKEKEDNAILKAIADLADKITRIEKRMDKDSADAARRNILIFDDELRRGDPHSEEAYNQILDDCNYYEKFCRANKDYENSKCGSACENIKRTYQIVKHEDRFI